MSTWSADRPYIEGMIEALGHAGDQPVLCWEGAGTTGSELLAAIYRYARALESLGIARGDLVAMYATQSGYAASTCRAMVSARVTCPSPRLSCAYSSTVRVMGEAQAVAA